MHEWIAMQNTWMMEELSGESWQLLSHRSNRHVPSFWVEQSPDLIMVFFSATQVAGCTPKATLLNVRVANG